MVTLALFTAVSTTNGKAYRLLERQELPKTAKWIHQLDFSTSGCLLVGLHRAAASVGNQAFETRSTRKVYLAVVEGELSVPHCPVLDAKLIEPRPRKVKRAKRRVGEAARSWQDRAVDANVEAYRTMLAELQTHTGSSEDIVLKRFLEVPLEVYSVNNKLRKQLRKFLKERGFAPPDVSALRDTQPSEVASPDSDQMDASSCKEEIGEASEPQEIAFGAYRLPSLPEDSFYVNAPIAEVSGSFHMQIGDSHHSGQWGETLFQILGSCRYQGRVVTKVRLLPQTGRRHQLRVHCLFLGHPIVGDATYCPEILETVCADAERMMLHAHELEVPLGSKEGLQDPSKDAVRLVAPDPFVIDSDGELRVTLPSYVSRSQGSASRSSVR